MLISKFGTIIEESLTEYEDANDIRIPEQYREFLKKYNGGLTPKTMFSINGVSTDLKGFYGIGDVKYSLNSVGVINKDGVYYLPIAMDSFGNDIMIDLNKGNVLFKNHENGSLKIIGDDFKGFINACKSEYIDKRSIKSVEEREKELIENGRGDVITDTLRDMWRVEINKYSSIMQEEIDI